MSQCVTKCVTLVYVTETDMYIWGCHGRGKWALFGQWEIYMGLIE